MATRGVKEAEGNFECMRAGFLRWMALIVVAVGLQARAQTNGIFADFTTSLGSFTCELDYTNSPKAVANFVGLATGERAWLDLVTGETRTNAFYDGLTFHRVLTNLAIQAGSPNGQGNDGPGYVFVDQFSSSLNFNSPWMLAMANSGPNYNGSQFFVTVAPNNPWNNSYVIFGRVVSGTNVVAAISHVATDANDKPLTNVFLQSVAIRRLGPAAQGFNINAQALAIVTNLPLRLTKKGTQGSLTFSNRLYSENFYYSTTDLASWAGTSLGFEVSAPISNTFPVAMTSPQEFFRAAQIQYPSSTFAPKDIAGKTLTLVFNVRGTATIVFNNSGGGTFTYAGSQGTVTSYSWYQDAYRGFLYPIQFSVFLPEMFLQLNFTSSAGGTFLQPGDTSAIPIAGTFSLGL
jgi:peptidyl-prolyl cis-trans isomerase A (cyclophilin A)